ncbi:MAG: RimK family alpha-L-glutamate ligase [Acidimicrobiales bacterium]
MRVAIATCTDWPELTPDDLLLADELVKQGATVKPLIWDDPAAEWINYDGVIVRSVWDYHHRVDEFYAWVRRAAAHTPFMNSAEILNRNAHKGYMHDFGEAGLAVVPTAWITGASSESLVSTMRAHGWDEVILKPAVSASALQTLRVTPLNLAAGEQLLDEILPRCEAMVQPCLASVREVGETAMVFFGGDFSHAVRRPSPLDHGEDLNRLAPPLPAVEPTQEQQAVAESILAALDDTPTYARVDLVDGDDGEPLLLELEMIEPYLFLASRPASAVMFASAVLKQLA